MEAGSADRHEPSGGDGKRCHPISAGDWILGPTIPYNFVPFAPVDVHEPQAPGGFALDPLG